MDYDESSDILGGRLHVSPQSSSAWSDPGQITLLLGLGLAAFYTWARLAPHYRQWKEMRYKKATRRRHGIPDDDNRPFNVAYAAAKQAQREDKGRPYLRDKPMPIPEEGETVAAPGLPIMSSFVKSVGYGSTYPPSIKAEASQSTLDGLAIPPGFQRERTPQTLPRPLPKGSVSRKPRASGAKQHLATRTSYGKHALDEESDSEPEMLAKKSRVEGEELTNGDEQVEWQGSDEDMEVDEAQPVKRGSKRVASSEDEEGLDHSRTIRRDKRARKVSLDKSAQSPDESMGDEPEEEEDGGEDVEDAARGKKRDRVEAGSTFGGDDYMMDDEGEKPKRRRRKGRVSNKFGEGLSRGQKRGRGSHSTESDDSESERPRQKAMRKKRGRKSQDDIVPLSNDPLCKGRPIGEEWESHGILFKVGPNGQRLRQELVKKSRSKFPMPSDSQHPDRRAHVDVYVEVWLSEEEYKLAKTRHELAWQDSSPTPPESQKPVDVAESPSKVSGKNLLWSSTISSRESPVKRGPLKQSATTNAGLRVAVFPPPPALSTRRISSVYHPPASPAAESPKLQKTKSYSKWEKQDLEAAAMSKIRDRQQSARIAIGTKASPLSSTPSTVPATTTTPPVFGAPSTAGSLDKATEKPSAAPLTFSFPPSNTGTTATISKSSTLELPKISTTPVPSTTSNAQSKPAPTLSFAPTAPASSNAAAASAPPLPAPPASSSIPNFFAKPATSAVAPAPTSVSTTSSIPNFFAKPTAAASATPVTPAATSTPAGPAAQSTFSFGVTSTQPTTTATASPAADPSSALSDSTKATEQAKGTPGASLLSRIGMGPPPSQPAASSPFSFAKPETATAVASTTDAAKTVNSTPTLASTSGPLKFNFGVASKPASASSTPAPTTTPAATTPAVPSAPSAFAPASTSSTPKFSFGITGSSQPAAAPSAVTNPFGGTTTNSAAPSSAAKSPFSFGTPSASANPSAFGGASGTTSAFGVPAGTSSAPSPFGAAAANTAKPAEPTKLTFGFGTTNGVQSTTSASPFGAPASGASSSPFGVPTASPAPSPFGSASNNAAKPAEAPKSAFSFGNTGASSATAPSPFGNATHKTDTQTTKPMVGFGASSAPVPSFGATNGAAASQESKPTFGFGAPASSAAAASPAAPAAGSAAAPFSFNFGQSSSTPQSSGTPAASGPQVNGLGSGSFGFGAPSGGAFSFGSNPGQGQQQK